MKRNFQYLLYNSKCRMILVVLIFIIAIGTNMAYLRVLAFYDDQINGKGLFQN